MKNIKWKNGLIIASMCFTFGWISSAADQGLGDMMFVAGTVKTLPGGAERAWLQWMATDNALLKNRTMDVYWKLGEADSSNTFSLKGQVQQLTDPRAIALLLKHGEAMGENISRLTMAIDSLYAGSHPAGTLTLSEKLAALVSGSQADLELYNNLVFIGRAHPAVAMIIGQAFSCEIPDSSYSTFEVRDHKTAEVIGRITLRAGVPTILPAPGPLVQIQNESPKGNLNVRLSWDIPVPLKRLSLLQFGYNIYRMPKAFAEDPSRRYDLHPPSYAQLSTVLANPEVVKVNRMPIVIDPALATPESYYFIDDNQWESGGSKFVDGAQYYYFVSALDLLGRDGEWSQGLLASPYDRMAPTVPHGLRARAISGYDPATKEKQQWIEISWKNTTNNADVAAYYVYRHNSISDMQSNAVYAVSNRLSTAIIPIPGAKRMTFEDHSLGTNDYSRTYWYTVRAMDASAGGGNLSGNSAPVFAVLRDWEGPAISPGAHAVLNVKSMNIDPHQTQSPVALSDPFNILLSCTRSSFEIKWVEFSYYAGNYQGLGSETNAVSLGRYYFQEGSNQFSKAFSINPLLEHATFFARIGAGRLVSEWRWNHETIPSLSKYGKELPFQGIISSSSRMVSGFDPLNPVVHDWGNLAEIAVPLIVIPGSKDAESCRVYRRVDNARRTLIYQGNMPEDLHELSVTNYMGGTVNGGKVCYYYQLFDEHGNPSPVEPICCFLVEPRIDLPIPILNKIKPTGSATNAPNMKLNWFCTTPGVERFEIAVAVKDGSLLTSVGDLQLHGGLTNTMNLVVGGVTNLYRVGFYQTGRVGTTFGTSGSPQFQQEGTVVLEQNYYVMVRAIGTVGTKGGWSQLKPFRWHTVSTQGPQVPWPTRSLPIVQRDLFHVDLAPLFLISTNLVGDSVAPVGIKIGEIPASISFERIIDSQGSGTEKDKLRVYQFTDNYNLDDFIFENAAVTGASIFPCVLYRYQMTNELYRNVSGDVAQVSPLMEGMAYGKLNDRTTLYDPFIYITRPISGGNWGIYLVDTQPVIRGAKYKYLIMHFDENTKEPERIIPAGTVTIP